MTRATWHPRVAAATVLLIAALASSGCADGGDPGPTQAGSVATQTVSALATGDSKSLAALYGTSESRVVSGIPQLQRDLFGTAPVDPTSVVSVRVDNVSRTGKHPDGTAYAVLLGLTRKTPAGDTGRQQVMVQVVGGKLAGVWNESVRP